MQGVSISPTNNMPSEPHKEKLITLRLVELVDKLFEREGHTEFSREAAELFALSDPDEALIHVQFKDLNTQQNLKRPIVWRKSDWLGAFAKYEYDKKQSNLRRSGNTKHSANITALAKVLKYRFFIEQDTAIVSARRMIQEGDKQVIEECLLGAPLHDLTDEERIALGEIVHLKNPRNVPK